jgi:hypothetical protein
MYSWHVWLNISRFTLSIVSSVKLGALGAKGSLVPNWNCAIRVFRG